MAKHLELTDAEAGLLEVIVTWWAEGLPDVVTHAESDDSLEEMTDLLEVTHSVGDQQRVTSSILEKLVADD